MRLGAGIRSAPARRGGNSGICDVRDVASCSPHGILGVGVAKSFGFRDRIDCGEIRCGYRLQTAAARSLPPATATPSSIAQVRARFRSLGVSRVSWVGFVSSRDFADVSRGISRLRSCC